MTKTLKSRISQKHDIEANWLLVPDFIPLNGEIIIYDEDENYSHKRIKIGDGKTAVGSLSFIDQYLIDFIETFTPLTTLEEHNNSDSSHMDLRTAILELKRSLFVGTREHYELVKDNYGYNALIIFTDDEDISVDWGDNSSTTSILGQAILGQMVLG